MLIHPLDSVMLFLFALNVLSISSLYKAKFLAVPWIFISSKFYIALKLLKEAIIGFCLHIISFLKFFSASIIGFWEHKLYISGNVTSPGSLITAALLLLFFCKFYFFTVLGCWKF